MSKYSMIVEPSTLFPPGGTHRLYGRRDARRYVLGRQTEFSERLVAKNGDETADELR